MQRPMTRALLVAAARLALGLPQAQVVLRLTPKPSRSTPRDVDPHCHPSFARNPGQLTDTSTRTTSQRQRTTEELTSGTRCA